MAVSSTIVINELLYYVQNRINNSPDDIIATTCVNFYAFDEIDAARNELQRAFENSSSSLDGRRVLTRRRDPKKSMEDIIATFKSCDVTNEQLPSYVSRNLHRIPHDDEGNQSIKCVMASISKLERQISEMSKTVITKSDFDGAINPIRQKIGIGASSADKSVLPTFFENLINSPTPRKAADNTVNSKPSFSATVLTLPSPVNNKPHRASARSSGSSPRITLSAATAAKKAASSRDSTTPATRPRKTTDVVIGKSVNSGALSFRGADLTIHRFIGRVLPDVDAESMKRDLENLGISVLALEENQTKNSRFKSFHLTAKRSDAGKIDDPETWPENIVVRRFFLPKRKPDDAVNPSVS